MTNTEGPIASAVPRVHVYVLLDRSGSMQSLRGEVIAGLNELIAEQRMAASMGPEPRLTLVRFDDVQPDEVVLDAVKVTKAPLLVDQDFVPRGTTPLLDATHAVIERAKRRERRRSPAGKRAESVVIVTITDGAENASRHATRQQVLDAVRAQEALGWTFVFLGAGLDAYAEAGGIGYDARSVQQFAPDGQGAAHAFQSLSKGIASRRQKLRDDVAFLASDFFEGDKPAEVDERIRRPRPLGRSS